MEHIFAKIFVLSSKIVLTMLVDEMRLTKLLYNVLYILFMNCLLSLKNVYQSLFMSSFLKISRDLVHHI